MRVHLVQPRALFVARWCRRRDSVGRAERGGGRVHRLAVAAAGARPRGMGPEAVPVWGAEVVR